MLRTQETETYRHHSRNDAVRRRPERAQDISSRICFSFNSAENRAAFLQDEDAYCAKFRLTKQQRAAVKSRNVLQLIEAGGNVYYLAKLVGIFGLSVQDIGAQQTGMSVEAFKHKLAVAGR